jgi:hypothetical protein
MPCLLQSRPLPDVVPSSRGSLSDSAQRPVVACCTCARVHGWLRRSKARAIVCRQRHCSIRSKARARSTPCQSLRPLTASPTSTTPRRHTRTHTHTYTRARTHARAHTHTTHTHIHTHTRARARAYTLASHQLCMRISAAARACASAALGPRGQRSLRSFPHVHRCGLRHRLQAHPRWQRRRAARLRSLSLPNKTCRCASQPFRSPYVHRALTPLALPSAQSSHPLRCHAGGAERCSAMRCGAERSGAVRSGAACARSLTSERLGTQSRSKTC